MYTAASVIPIFFSSDNNYLPFLAVSIRSLIENASPDYRYRIHILNNGLDASRLSHILAMERENVEIRPVDVSSVIAPIAERLNLDRRYLSRIFKQQTGQTVQEYLISTRIEEATRLLKQGMSVEESAHLCGYEDVFNFSKAFKKRMGVNPLQIKMKK